MRDDPPPPPITITDPSRPGAPIELLASAAQRTRPSPRVTAAALLIALLAGVVVVVVHLRSTRQQQQATERRLASLHLTAVIEGTNAAFDDDALHGVWGAGIRIRSGAAEEFRVLAVTLDEDAWKVARAGLNEASTSHLVEVTFTGSCPQFELLATPTKLRVSGRRPGGPVISRTVGFDASLMLELPRRSCGLADLASSLNSEVVGAHRRGRVAIMDVQLRNPSRHPGRLTALSMASTQVTTRPRLPVVLPPSVAGHPGHLVRLQLTVRYVLCLPGRQDTDLNLDLVDDAGIANHVVVSQDDPTGQLLDQLAGETCRQ